MTFTSPSFSRTRGVTQMTTNNSKSFIVPDRQRHQHQSQDQTIMTKKIGEDMVDAKYVIPDREWNIVVFLTVAILSGVVFVLNISLVAGTGPFFNLGLRFLEGMPSDSNYTENYKGTLFTPLVSSSLICVFSLLLVGLVWLKPAHLVESTASYNPASFLYKTNNSKSWVTKLVRSRRRTYTFLVTAIICLLIAQLVTMVFSMVVLDLMVQGVEQADSVPTVPLNANEEPSFVTVVHDYQLAMFNECCAADGQSKQAHVVRCTSSATCEPPQLYGVEGPKALCACYSVSDQLFDTFRAHVDATDMCSSLKDAQVSIRQSTYITRTNTRAQFIFRASEVPVVGDSSHPTYGCGAGYARGFQWALYEYVMQTAKPFAATLTIVTTVQFLIVIVMLSRCCGICATSGMLCEDAGTKAAATSGNRRFILGVEFEYQDEDGNVLGVREISCELEHKNPDISHDAPSHIRGPSCPPMMDVGPAVVQEGRTDSVVVADLVHSYSPRRVHEEREAILSISGAMSPPPIPQRWS